MRPKSFRRRNINREIHPGFQIAPMIDVIFVILLFFMVAGGHARKEAGLDSKLPGTTIGDAFSSPDKIEIRIESDGQVLFNEEPLDEIGAGPLVGLTQAIRDLKQATGSDLSKVQILISAEDQVKYQWLVDVLDVLAREKISGVNFQARSVD